jgi:SAM-dependent methyltransferase
MVPRESTIRYHLDTLRANTFEEGKGIPGEPVERSPSDRPLNRMSTIDLLRRVLASQRRISARIDRILPSDLRTIGMTDYQDRILPSRIRRGQCVYDIGGGKRPHVSGKVKAALSLRVVGLDISPDQLDAAPAGIYDQTVVCDIGRYRGPGDADLVIASAVLEHVDDIEGAFDGIASLLARGGEAVMFVPSRNALFARINLLLPERLKRAALALTRDEDIDSVGFPAYYRRCTPLEFKAMAKERGLEVISTELYYMSSYFFSFVPAYLVWRLWILLFRRINEVQSAESFAIVLRKPR